MISQGHKSPRSKGQGNLKNKLHGGIQQSKEAAQVQKKKKKDVYYNYLEYSKVINHGCIYILIFISVFK